MLADSQYGIRLNGKGYIMLEDSYRKRSQQPFNPRFSTGDPSFGDLSFWQHLVQEQWDAGQGLDIFGKTFYNANQLNSNLNSKNRIKESVGWDFRNTTPTLGRGGPQLALGNRSVALTSGAWVQAYKTNYNQRFKFIDGGYSGSTTGNKGIILVGTQAAMGAGEPTGLTTALVPTASDDPLLFQLDAFDACYASYSADHNGSIFCTFRSGSNTHLGRINQSGGAVTDILGTVNIGPAGVIQAFVGTDGTHAYLLYGGSGGFSYFELMDLTAALTTQGNTYVTAPSTGNSYPVIGAAAKDTNGTIYIVTQSPTAPSSGNNQLNSGEVIFFTQADLQNYNPGLRISGKSKLPSGFYATGIVAVNGTIYVLGAWKPNSATQYAAILKYPDEIIWTSQYNYSGDDNYILSYYELNASEVHFIAKSSLGGYASIYRLRRGDVVEEIGSVPLWTAGTVDILAMSSYGKRFYWYNQVANALSSSNDVQGNLGSSPLVLELAEFGGNTPLISKYPHSVKIELDTAIDSGKTLTVYINGVSYGTMVAADGTTKEITAPTTPDFTATGFKIKLSLDGTSVWTGSLRRVTLKYVPVQFKKSAWSVGIRATRQLKLLDGSKEQLSPATELANLKTAWQSNIPITFIDVDGTSYSVLITDIDQRKPLIDSRQGAEAMVFLELLEI